MTLLVPPPLRSSQPCADIDGFFSAVAEAFKLHCQAQKVPSGTQPVLEESFPEERLKQPGQPFDVIMFHVADCEMAATSNDGSRVPYAPQLRERRPHPDKDGYNLVTMGWWENAGVIFTLYSRSNPNANTLAIWFHKFLIRYAHAYKFFEARGVKQFRFVKRLEDDVQQREGQELHRRRLVYSFRIEYLDSYEEKQLQSVSTSIDLQVPTAH